MLLLCDLNAFSDMEEAYDYLEKELSLPSWFGRNMDGLYDCLTDIGYPLTFLLPPVQEGLPAKRILPVLEDAAKENPNLSILSY